jgi:hypothetical protein
MATQLKGALNLRTALRKFEPDLAKETTKQIASFLKPLVKDAKGFMPSNADLPSGWLQRPNAKGRWATRFYDQATARRGMGYKTSPSKRNRNGFVSLASVNSKNIGAIIYEWAGRTAGITGNFSPKLGGQLKGKNKGMTGRALYRAYAQDEGKARAGVIKAIELSAKKLNARSKA